MAGFIAESIQGVGGTVVYPDNYLKQVYQYVREAGGLCIADEVQTGFARTGSHYWGFQNHGVTPDIGNTHSLLFVQPDSISSILTLWFWLISHYGQGIVDITVLFIYLFIY